MSGEGRNASPARPVRFGLIGCGRIGALGDDRAQLWPDAARWLPYSHGSAIVAAGGELVALCDVDPVALSAAAARFGTPHCYTDYRAMCLEQSLDALSVATRTDVRPEILMFGAQQGLKGVYCEKPLSRTLEETDAVSTRLTDAGVVFVYGPQRRYMPVFASAREAIRLGRIGRLTGIAIRWPAGPLLWRHPHSVDLACFLAGDPPIESVRAEMQVPPGAVRGVIVDADPIVLSASIVFSDGVIATVTSDDAHVIEVSGTSGSIVIEQDGRRTTLSGASGDMTLDSIDGPCTSGTATAMWTLISWMCGSEAARYGVANAVTNQEVLFGWLESSLAGGQMIRFPLARQGRLITGRTGDRFA